MSSGTPVLDGLESTASVGGRTEKLSEREYLLLEQLLRYPRQAVSRDSLRRAIGDDEARIPDRRLDALIGALIRKTNVLNPVFPMVRSSGRDSYLYSDRPPPRKPAAD